MKKVLSIVLALLLLLSFAACGEPAEDADNGKESGKKPGATQTTTKPGNTVELVTDYETGNSPLGAFRMTFTYDEGYRSGTAELFGGDTSFPGTFTCDENYNIDHMDFTIDTEEEKGRLLFDCTFDEAHRLLTARIVMEDDEGKQQLRYSASYAYDSEGRTLRARIEMPQYILTTEAAYNAAGQLLQVTSITESPDGAFSSTNTYGYAYDADGYMIKRFERSDQDQTELEIPVTHEIREDGIYYTMEWDHSKILLVTNENHQHILQEYYDGGVLISRITNAYDEAGRILRTEQQIIESDHKSVLTMEYTASGRLKKQIQYNNGIKMVIHSTTFRTVEI